MAFNSGLEGVVAAETVLSEVHGEAGRLVLRGHRLQDIAGRRSVEWLIADVWRGFAAGNLSEPSLRRDLAVMRAAVFGRVFQVLE
jgi:citrate synthase